MIAYLDTNVLLYLNKPGKRIPPTARRLFNAADILISPAVLLELEYLAELGRTTRPAMDFVRKLQNEISLTICDLPFVDVTQAAMTEKWTRDPFDRLIVAQAKANGFSPLITSDRKIRQNYPRAVW